MRFTTEVCCFVSTHSARGEADAKPALGPERVPYLVSPLRTKYLKHQKGAMTVLSPGLASGLCSLFGSTVWTPQTKAL